MLNPARLSRSSNALEYWLPPNLGGLYGHAMVLAGEANNASGNFKFTSLRLGYRSAPVDAAVYTGSTRIDAQAANMKQTGVYGAYTLGSSPAMLSITHSSFCGSKHWHLMSGLRASLGQWVLKASYKRLDQKGVDATNARIDANDASQFAVGTDYLLSMRTALYKSAARLSNNGAARFAIPGGPGVAAAGSSSTGFDLGIRHSF